MSLRSRLILTHVLIILLTLVIAAIGLLFILRNFQNEVEFARLEDAAIPLAVQARALVQANTPPLEILTRLQTSAEGVGNILLITQRGVVLADTTYGLTAKNITGNPPKRPDRQVGFLRGEFTVKETGKKFLYAAVAAGQLRGQAVFLALATNEPSFFSMLDDIGPSLLFAGAVALVISFAFALLLARSIAGPIARLTRGTEAIARGQYDHRVPDSGRDEIARLASSFNTMAQQVQRARQMEKDFVADVSHELKTPLTSIQGFAQAFLDGAVVDMDGARRAAQTIFDETARMARLIGDLLTLARLESGQIPLTRAQIDLRDVLPRWVERFQARAHARDEKIVTIIDALPLITGDAGRLEEVISNLIDNAIKYNRAGGTVTLTAQLESPSAVTRRGAATRGPARVQISVADTGEGIPAADLPRVFERFYRGDKARVAGGTGLGLAIAHEIIAAHGGEITVASEKNRGSVFTAKEE
ncbi:MAG: HAMP domain-containing protein [Chloroflexi bacterium]|nr:HAMP domain-containing protein [Chloroflexota bacterium]